MKKASVIADVSVPMFKIVARFASCEPVRDHISGVRLQRHPKGGVIMVATDGHRMMVVHDERGRCARPITIDAKCGLKAARAADKNIRNEETRWRVRRGDLAPQAREKRLPCKDTKTFPDWLHVVRLAVRDAGASPCAVNPRYLAEFASCFEKLAIRPYPKIIVGRGKISSDPFLITSPDVPHALGILMPMRNPDNTVTPPAFLRPLLDVETKATAKAKAGGKSKRRKARKHGR